MLRCLPTSRVRNRWNLHFSLGKPSVQGFCPFFFWVCGSFPSQSLGAQKEYQIWNVLKKGSIKPLYMIRKCISMSSFIVNNISKLYLKVKHIRSFFLVDDKEFQSKHLLYGQSSLSGDPTKLSWHVLFPILKGSHLKLPTHQPTSISADETALTTLRR